ncbi:hypothetical protein [Spiroplasma endosymbiont of Diplazon laetatorius]|uniref:hypothetical protein n=1 Tax=Spiroplasma endosymbiont of Diplazon laetatorius TaxID=3066322 RepID=UPI0030CBB22D
MNGSDKTFLLPTWGLIILIFILIIGLALAFWGAFSAFNFQRPIKNKLIDIFKDKKIINKKDLNTNLKGIFALTFKNVDINDFFVPIFIFKTKDLNIKIKELLDEIESNSQNNIAKYIKEKQSNINNIIFVQLESEDSDENLEKWIEIADSKDKGFNK